MKIKSGNILSLGLVLLGLTSLAQADSPSKKGVGIWLCPRIGMSLENLQVSWFYNWEVAPGFTASRNIEFVPMIWGKKNVNEKDLAVAQKNGRTLLGFNEPDCLNQAAMPVAQALALWPRLEATGMRLGSPACGSGVDSKTGWMGQFMKGVQQRGYRVDFICVHCYPGTYHDPAASTQLLKTYLQNIHALYHKPIWLTEFALSNWKKSASGNQQLAFMQRAVPMLEALPYVERYAWFALPPYRKGDGGALTKANLCDRDGRLNPCGITYQHFP